MRQVRQKLPSLSPRSLGIVRFSCRTRTFGRMPAAVFDVGRRKRMLALVVRRRIERPIMAQSGLIKPSRLYRPTDPNEPGDEQIGEWTRERLERMDHDFAAAMAREERQASSTPPARSASVARRR
jgi:hypothetical protein